MDTPKATDILVRTDNPDRLDRVLNTWGAVLVGGGIVEDCYVVRVFGDPGFIEFAIRNQGYGEVIRRLDDLV